MVNQYPFDWQKFHEWRKTVERKPTAVIYQFKKDELFWYGEQLFKCVGNAV